MQGDGQCGFDSLAFVEVGEFYTCGGVGRRVDLYLGVEASDLGGDVCLLDVQVSDFGVVPEAKAGWAPDAAGDEGGPPVPAVLVGGLADVGLIGGLDDGVPFVLRSTFACGFVGGGEDDAELVGAGFEEGLGVGLPL